MSKTPGAKRRPSFLNPAFFESVVIMREPRCHWKYKTYFKCCFSESGIWDPEKWALSDRSECYPHAVEDHKKRERLVDVERDIAVGKRRSSGDGNYKLLHLRSS